MTINKKSIVNRYFLIVVVMLLLGVFASAPTAATSSRPTAS